MTHAPDPRGHLGLATYCLVCGEHLVLRRLPDGSHKWNHVNDIYLKSDDPIYEEDASV